MFLITSCANHFSCFVSDACICTQLKGVSLSFFPANVQNSLWVFFTVFVALLCMHKKRARVEVSYKLIIYGRGFSTHYSPAFGVNVGIVKVGENLSGNLRVFNVCEIP